jgi:tRNA A-37 threonylcarbamoyl transferase component Bud32
VNRSSIGPDGRALGLRRIYGQVLEQLDQLASWARWLDTEGRASQIFDLGDGRVWRRYKAGGHPCREAEFMRIAREHGFSTPAVLDVTRDGLLLERIDGPTLHAQVIAGRRTIDSAASELRRLHIDLHRINGPRNTSLIHGDLHWKNVLCSDTGSVVIDWANARWGDPATDVALTWVILQTSSGPLGRQLARRYAALLDVEVGKRAAIRVRQRDANLSDTERRALAAVLP